MASLSSLISLFVWIAPWLIPRALAFFRSIRASSRPGLIRPTPPKVKLCLNVLYAFILVSLVRTLPWFSPLNIYKETNSRLAIPTSVLFNRLLSMRTNGLSPLEIGLKDKYFESSTDFGLLYAAYGPDVMANCAWCSTASTDTYFMYAFSSILAPHLYHILILGLITSSFFSGPEGARWRIYATAMGAFLAAIELGLVLRNDWKLNTTKRSLSDVDFFYWRLRMYRLLSFAVADALLGWAIWLTSTNRWLVKPPPVSQQIQYATVALNLARNKVTLLSRLRNAVIYDEQLHSTSVNHSLQEPRQMAEIEQERDVVDAKRLALSRMDIDRIRNEAQIWTDRVWPILSPPVPPLNSEHVKVE